MLGGSIHTILMEETLHKFVQIQDTKKNTWRLDNGVTVRAFVIGEAQILDIVDEGTSQLYFPVIGKFT